MADIDDLLVDSSPSKKYFLDMITKDVTVESSILDLIDNAIDSGKKNRKDGSTKNIEITLSLEDDCFTITDNCGGMNKETAKNKAFRFGNNEERTSGALGMYGIGMKRSIFKIGNDFVVESKCGNDSFKVYMNRDSWLKLEDKWIFYIEDTELDFEDGVHIRITKLSEALKNYLKNPSNLEKLKDHVASSYKETLGKYFTLKINGRSVAQCNEKLYESNILKSYVKSYEMGNVKIKIIAGIWDPSPSNAGWNIICNGRMVIEKNKDAQTGWESPFILDDEGDMDSDLKSTDKRLPVFHNDFARFRGYVYLDSDNANNLPLNTTKDGIDMQHEVYLQIFSDMTYAMHIILPKLRDFQLLIRDMKKSGKVPPTFSEQNLSVLAEKSEQEFCLKLEEFKGVERIKNISMSISENEITKLKDFFEVKTNKELGEVMFDFIKKRVSLDE